MVAARIFVMRYLLLLLPLAAIARGETTPKVNCTASSQDLKVTVDYVEWSAYAVRWDPPADIKECVHNYTVRVSVQGNGTLAVVENTRSTYWSSRSVHPCSNYSVSVEALGEAGVQLASGATSFFSPPSEVTDYKVIGRTSASLLMTWVVPKENICVQKYVLSWRNTTEEKDEGSDTLQTNDTNYNITGLNPCTMYSVSITGIAADNVETSQGLSVYTAAHGAPLAVSDVSVVPAGSSSISVTWKKTSSCVEWYKVCMDMVGSKENCSQVSGYEQQWTSGAVIKPCTNYTVTVTAVDYADQSSAPQTSTIATAPGEVGNLKVSSRDASSMTVTWSTPDSDGSKCLKNYELYVCNHGDPYSCDALVASPASSDNNYVVPNLADCEDYDILVKSVGTEDQRSYGTTFLGYTDVTDKNNALANFGAGLDFTPSTEDILVLQAGWDLADQHDCLLGYRVCYTDKTAKGEPNCGIQGVEDVDWSTTNVNYCSDYTVSAEAITVGNISYPQVSTEVFTPPHAVVNVTTRAVDGNKIHVSWGQPPTSSSSCMQGYVVHWCQSGDVGCNKDNDTTPSISLDSKTLEHVIDDLHNCTSYLVWVAVLGDDGTESEASFTYAKAGGGVPGKIGSLSAPTLTCGSIYVEWDHPSAQAECVANYEVCWKGVSNGTKTCDTVSYLNTQHSIKDLQPSTAYTVTVAAMGAGGESSEAAAIQATTEGMTQLEELSLSSRTERSISVSWNSPEKNAECVKAMSVAWCYKDSKSPSSDNCQPTVNNSASLSNDATQFNITDLLPCSNYSVTVMVVTAGNVLSSGRTISVHTLNESPFNIGKLSHVMNSSTVVMKWEAPHQADTCKAGYHVCWQQQKTYASPACGHTTTESFMLDDLPACEAYIASVRTVTADGSMSNATSINLDLATPSEVRNLTIASHSSSSLIVSWLPPLMRAECVKNYYVCIAGSLGVNETCESASSQDTEHKISGLQPKTQYKITLVALGPEDQKSAASSVQIVTDASGSGSSGSNRIYLCSSNSLIASIVVFLLAQYLRH